MLQAAEHELLIQAQAGDCDAFAELQTRLESPVRRFVWRLIGSSDAEDDIVQDSFIALYKNLRHIYPAEKLRPYLFRIVRNRCYDELRRQGRFRQVSLDDDEPSESWAAQNTPLDGSSQPEEVTHWLMLYLDVQKAIDRLPEMQRQTLILYAEEELSYQEIAQVMNTNIGTVKSRLYYAKRTLRQLLSAETVQVLDAEFNQE
ncbi:MAG: RNA polymerase sigma factor [Chloroflexi bacterium]|nr:RNA polymerase sigma factor [Chloroflexota bacterium]